MNDADLECQVLMSFVSFIGVGVVFTVRPKYILKIVNLSFMVVTL